jgi:Tol biopolymer transport system component
MTQRLPRSPGFWKKLSLFDRTVMAIALILLILITVVLVRGNQSFLRVTHYSWRNSNIGAQTKMLTMRFSHPVNPQAIEENLTLDPPLAGTTSWQGQNWFYTLSEIPRYGTNYQLTLTLAAKNAAIQGENFNSLITSRGRTLVYIGLNDQERGRLVFYDITNPQKPQKIILTPKDLTVRQFQIYPQGDRIVFTAADPTRRNAQQQLFTVTTGINNNTPVKTLPGKLERLLENQDYNNQALMLTRSGNLMILNRQNRHNSADTGLWVLPQNEAPRPLGIQGTQFIVAPQGDRLAVSQAEGLAIIPLRAETGTSQFLTGMGEALTFSSDGKQLLLTQQNPDYSHSLVSYDLISHTPQEIIRGPYPILDCQFAPRHQSMAYCLRTDYVPQENGEMIEEPYLSLVDLKQRQSQPLLALPNYPEVDVSLAPDGLALIFDQVVTTNARSSNDVVTQSQKTITDGRIWLLPLPEQLASGKPVDLSPQELTPGYAPQWMP